MKRYFCQLVLLIVVSSVLALADTIKTSDFIKVKTILDQADQQTLVIFDVDDVLIHPFDQIIKSAYKSDYQKIIAGLIQKIGLKKTNIMQSQGLLQRQCGPVDDRFIVMIQALQRKGIKVIALTNCETGKFEVVESLEDWRIKELNQKGYHFEQSWQNMDAKILDEFIPKDVIETVKNPRPSLFKGGILFASALPKGEVLKAFFSYFQFKPTKIIFVDDKRRHVESVEKAAKDLHVQFKGIEYSAVYDVEKKPLDMKRIQFQFDTLEKTGRWMGDGKAQEHLRKIAPAA